MLRPVNGPVKLWSQLTDWSQILVGDGRSGRPEVFLGKGVLKICSKFSEEHPCRSVISIKLLGTPLGGCS